MPRPGDLAGRVDACEPQLFNFRGDVQGDCRNVATPGALIETADEDCMVPRELMATTSPASLNQGPPESPLPKIDES